MQLFLKGQLFHDPVFIDPSFTMHNRFSFLIVGLIFSFLFSLVLNAQEGVRSANGLISPMERPPLHSGNVYALIVGVSQYSHIPSLAYADDDACLFRQYLQSKAGGSVPDSNIHVLTNKDANNSNLWERLGALRKIAQKGDLVYIYFAGHGSSMELEYYFLNTNCVIPNTTETLNGTDAVHAGFLRNYIKKSFVGVKVIFVVDACRTGDIPGALEAMEQNSSLLESDGIGYLTLLSASQGQPS